MCTSREESLRSVGARLTVPSTISRFGASSTGAAGKLCCAGGTLGAGAENCFTGGRSFGGVHTSNVGTGTWAGRTVSGRTVSNTTVCGAGFGLVRGGNWNRRGSGFTGGSGGAAISDLGAAVSSGRAGLGGFSRGPDFFCRASLGGLGMETGGGRYGSGSCRCMRVSEYGGVKSGRSWPGLMRILATMVKPAQ